MSAAKPVKLPPLPLVLTANDLLDGHVVYWDGLAWTTDARDARVAMTPQAAQELDALVATTEGAVAEAYLATVRLDADGHPHPAHYREAIRVGGPTIAFGALGALGVPVADGEAADAAAPATEAA